MKPELQISRGGSVFRKIAMGSWRTAADPAVYGLLEIDMTKALAYIKKKNPKLKSASLSLISLGKQLQWR
ncbi:hypothetical protein [Bdellovibrio sp. HCB2-146]|uniref:hypothetical protein n=1 Tax=Bdellovibrio sp. HCB2-146 TaxID=3394362 RepID=UPI0039BD8BDE